MKNVYNKLVRDRIPEIIKEAGKSASIRIADEAADFTTWLAANIDYINDKLGFALNVLETEKQIGSFNVDIYCEDEQGNSVIIENQLERTDHSHLGQILTYAVGVMRNLLFGLARIRVKD